jgi:hypothetical protein
MKKMVASHITHHAKTMTHVKHWISKRLQLLVTGISGAPLNFKLDRI